MHKESISVSLSLQLWANRALANHPKLQNCNIMAPEQTISIKTCWYEIIFLKF